MAFTDKQKVAIRRYCGYPVYGGQPVQTFGHRFFEWYGTLEFRMNNLSPDEAAEVVDQLATLDGLRDALATASDNLDTDAAGPWKHNKHETRDRMRLYAYYREELCNFFGVPAGPKMPVAGVTWSM